MRILKTLLLPLLLILSLIGVDGLRASGDPHVAALAVSAGAADDGWREPPSAQAVVQQVAR